MQINSKSRKVRRKGEMVFWKREEFGWSDVELRVQELVQRSNGVDGGSQLRHYYKLYITILWDTR